MKKLSGLFAVFILSSTVHASQQFSYDGHFISSRSFDFTESDRFSGQFTFNPDAPNSEGYPPLPDFGGVPIGNIPLQYSRFFEQNQSSSVALNGVQTVNGNQSIAWTLVDNTERFMPLGLSLPDGSFIRVDPFAGRITPDVYDMISIGSGSGAMEPNPFGDMLPSLFNGTSFNIFALFAKDTFALDGVNAAPYQNPLEMQPLFLGFDVYKTNTSSTIARAFDYAGSGFLEHYSVTTVPLPGAAWLFGSALAGLALRLRKRA